MRKATEIKVVLLLIEELKVLLDVVKDTKDSDEFMIYLSESYTEKVNRINESLEKVFGSKNKIEYIDLNNKYLEFRFSDDYKEVITELEKWISVNGPVRFVKELDRNFKTIDRYITKLKNCSSVSKANDIALETRQLFSQMKRIRRMLKSEFNYVDRSIDHKLDKIDRRIFFALDLCSRRFNEQ